MLPAQTEKDPGRENRRRGGASSDKGGVCRARGARVSDERAGGGSSQRRAGHLPFPGFPSFAPAPVERSREGHGVRWRSASEAPGKEQACLFSCHSWFAALDAVKQLAEPLSQATWEIVRLAIREKSENCRE